MSWYWEDPGTHLVSIGLDPGVSLQESFEAACLCCKHWFSYSYMKILFAGHTSWTHYTVISECKKRARLGQSFSLQLDPELDQGARVNVLMKSE